jgi:glucosylceramidase
MGASDFSTVGNFSYDDGAADDPLANFSIAQDLKATIPVLKQVIAINKQTFIMATPWSPPAWMKNNNSMDGSGGAPGNAGLATNAYGPFGQYFVKFLQAYANAGIVVGAVTPQNEPLNGSANYPGMDFNAASELNFIAQNMGPALKAAGLSTFIWAYDHNWDVESYPEQVISDATAGGFTEGAAFHCYGGDASAMTTFHQKFPQKSIYMTECSGGDWQGDPFANTIDLAIDSTNNWARAIALWNLALDENKGPQNSGCGTCRGIITVNSQSGAVTYNADYYALGHFSKFVLPGASRVKSTSSNGSLSLVAFKNTNGRMAVVAHNTGSNTMNVRVGSGASAMNVAVPANAGVTFDWTP